MLSKTVVFFLFVCSFPAYSGYNANDSSVITGVYAYAGGDYIYFTLQDKPETGCNNKYFVIHESVPENRRQMMYSRLLLAYATKESVNIGYDNTAENCAHTYVRVHRVG